MGEMSWILPISENISRLPISSWETLPLLLSQQWATEEGKLKVSDPFPSKHKAMVHSQW